MGAGQSRADINDEIFHSQAPISFSQDVVDQLSDRLQASDVAPERQSNIDAHIRSRIQAELEHLRKEEDHVRREIESTLEKENLDRERAMAGIPDSEATVGTINSSTALSEDLEQIRSKIDRYHPRKRLELFPQVKSAGKTVLSCYKRNQGNSLDCWQEVKLFKDAVTAVEQEYLKTF